MWRTVTGVDVSLAVRVEDIVDACWPMVVAGQQVFPLAAHERTGLQRVWQGCLDWPTDHFLAVTDRDELVGASGVLVLEQECRLIGGPLGVPWEPVADAVLGWLHLHHPGAAVSMGIGASHTAARAWAVRRGFKLREASTVTTATCTVGAGTTFDGVVHRPSAGSAWSERHDTAAGEIWWSSERVVEDAEHWVCLSDSSADGYVAARLASLTSGVQPELEVFVAAGGDQVLCELLAELRRVGHERGATRVVFFCDPAHEAAARQAGYTVVGHYQDWVR